VITSENVYIKDPKEVIAFLQSIEHKPNRKLFEKIDIDAYLKGLLSLRKVETK
jgi:DNA-binding transcriptional regulator WhiA